MRTFKPFALIATLSLALSCIGASAGESEMPQVSREIKASIEMAQRFIASQQKSDGSYMGGEGHLTAIVASCTLAFMATGNLPGEGPYARNVSLGVNYIVGSAQPSGMLLKNNNASGPMYNHGLATLCLSEVWGQTRDPRVSEKLHKAIELHIRCQGPGGSWTYQPKPQDGDLSITIMQVLALRAAKDAGVPVPKETIDRALRFVFACKCPPDGNGFTGFGYSGPSGAKFSTSSAAVMALQVCGDYKPGDLKGGLEYIMNARKTRLDQNEWYMYGHYYAGQAIFQSSRFQGFEKYWKWWYPSVSQELMSKQVKSGQNRGSFTVQGAPGMLSTAWPVLVLAIPYNYLPIYQK